MSNNSQDCSLACRTYTEREDGESKGERGEEDREMEGRMKIERKRGRQTDNQTI